MKGPDSFTRILQMPENPADSEKTWQQQSMLSKTSAEKDGPDNNAAAYGCPHPHYQLGR